MGDLVSGGIRFSRYCRLPLTAGNYNVVVHQEVKELHAADPVTKADPADAFAPINFEFVVDGPRFALNPADIYSVYPPEGSTGDYEYSLPHVVLTRRTIPWERKIASTFPDHQPWMALLLFSAGDGTQGTGIPKIEPRKVSDLFNNLPSDVTGPQGFTPAEYELHDPCNAIDLDAELFRRVAPSFADLDYLAHVREVKTDHKETVSFLTDGSFSVVIGNRFPKARQGADPVENKAILVSLEGMQNFLPGKEPQNPVKTLRLAVLASWAFHCNKARDFKKSMEDLGKRLRPLRLKLAEDDAPEGVKYVLPAEETTEAAKYVRAAFSRGYTALNHHTRRGEKTASWYRGPLTPVRDAISQVKARYEFKAVPDGLVRYDHEKGLMDLTYAGASQLGRLLGLQDRSFAQALSEWRTEVQKQHKARLEKEELRRILRSQPADERLLQSPECKFLEAALSDALTATKAAPDTDGVNDADKQWPAATRHELPATVRDWLAKRVLLYGVPFLYLVPDERMLPLPSMRFFRIDPLWIKRLLEGACSVGRNSTEAELVDSILGDEFFRIAVNGSTKVRRRPPSDEDSNANGVLSGFALSTSPSLVPGLATGKLRAQGKVFSPSEIPVLAAAPAGATSYLFYNSSTGYYYQASDVGATAGDAFIGRVEASSSAITSVTQADGALSPTERIFPFEGFLLRSPIVRGWQGLEMEAWYWKKGETDPVPAPPLRIDRLAPDIMLCIFNGPLAKIEIRQPPEGMHFGADGFKKKHLRKLTKEGLGEQVELQPAKKVPFRGPEDLRVVDVTALTKLLHSPLDSFTSAEFAVQMTESPGRVEIKVGDKP